MPPKTVVRVKTRREEGVHVPTASRLSGDYHYSFLLLQKESARALRPLCSLGPGHGADSARALPEHLRGLGKGQGWPLGFRV